MNARTISAVTTRARNTVRHLSSLLILVLLAISVLAQTEQKPQSDSAKESAVAEKQDIDKTRYVKCAAGATYVSVWRAVGDPTIVASPDCGARLDVLQDGELWVKVRTQDGKVGYIPTAAVADRPESKSKAQQLSAAAANAAGLTYEGCCRVGWDEVNNRIAAINYCKRWAAGWEKESPAWEGWDTRWFKYAIPRGLSGSSETTTYCPTVLLDEYTNPLSPPISCAGHMNPYYAKQCDTTPYRTTPEEKELAEMAMAKDTDFISKRCKENDPRPLALKNSDPLCIQQAQAAVEAKRLEEKRKKAEALAQNEPKTGGILVEVNAERAGDEISAIGNISRGDGYYLVFEVTEVATNKSHVIACLKSDADCGLYTPTGEIPHRARYLMKYAKSDYPENKPLKSKYETFVEPRWEIVSGGGVELTGAVQILDETSEPEKWVTMTKRGSTKFFILKQRQATQICPSQFNGGHYGGKCITVVTPAPVPMKELPCAVCVTP
jgi:hypothetical protein